ncbi:hypothetical protein ACG9XL_17090 [Acinetobacter nosocomialis]|uniref:hypothetical protein n=1 Tax=Acinetobacter calcoaceticus/baumannii complex TaxID=909768 RepID=UPI00233F2C11|nr:hypothetical protein [Acinetobacter baumannii]MDC5567262.1 hypothetical protein [Acinetobacter baumannii]MDK2172874.1 hypothetical protein [Acinetobacter baumannii]MDK2183674.1 hypothetical protein [Acinetobacter baumannii]MDK2329498.1 hypothetical protein [Acinetobacter baumannii]
MSLNQHFRREFLLRVLMTIGILKLKNLTGLSEDQIESLANGTAEISSDEIESIYKALSEGA